MQFLGVNWTDTYSVNVTIWLYELEITFCYFHKNRNHRRSRSYSQWKLKFFATWCFFRCWLLSGNYDYASPVGVTLLWISFKFILSTIWVSQLLRWFNLIVIFVTATRNQVCSTFLNNFTTANGGSLCEIFLWNHEAQ